MSIAHGAWRMAQRTGRRGFSLLPSVLRLLSSVYCLLFILLLFSTTQLQAQEVAEENSPGLTASLDKESAAIGNIVELTLSYTLPEGSELISPHKIEGLEGLAVLNEQSLPGSIRVKLIIDKLGSWETGDIFLAYRDKDGNEKKMAGEPVSLSVLSNLGDRPEEAQLKPIQDIIPSQSLWLKYAPWVVGIILIMTIAGLIFYVFRKIRRGKEIAAALEPPHLRARKEIEDLEARALFENGDVKGFYFGFTEIIRKYLEGLRGFPAAEYTTEEIAANISNEEDRNILHLLRHADLVKFADSVPTSARKEEEVRTALSYIDETGKPEQQEATDITAEVVEQ